MNSTDVNRYFPELGPFFHEQPYKAFITSKVDEATGRSKNKIPSDIEKIIDQLFTEDGVRFTSAQGTGYVGFGQKDLLKVLYKLQETTYVSMEFSASERTATGVMRFGYAVFTVSMDKIMRFMEDEKKKIDRFLAEDRIRYICKQDVLCKGCYGYNLTEAHEREFSCGVEDLVEMSPDTYVGMRDTAMLCKTRLEDLLVKEKHEQLELAEKRIEENKKSRLTKGRIIEFSETMRKIPISTDPTVLELLHLSNRQLIERFNLNLETKGLRSALRAYEALDLSLSLSELSEKYGISVRQLSHYRSNLRKMGIPIKKSKMDVVIEPKTTIDSYMPTQNIVTIKESSPHAKKPPSAIQKPVVEKKVKEIDESAKRVIDDATRLLEKFRSERETAKAFYLNQKIEQYKKNTSIGNRRQLEKEMKHLDRTSDEE